MEIALYIGLSLLLLGLGFVLGGYITRLKNQSQQGTWMEKEKLLQKNLEHQNTEILNQREILQQTQLEKERLGQVLVRKDAELENLRERQQEQIEEIEQLQEKFTKEFENLANKILDEKSVKFTEQNKENIKTILTPLQEKIQLFEKKVEETRKENYGIHSALKEQLQLLQSQNLKITQEAENLTKALKGDSKMQGNWGELVLERVLEKSGLEKDREYIVQQNFTREDGSRFMPDVIILLPNGNKMVVDSKVSLTDYERYVNADEEMREIHLKAHITSLKKHVDQLSSKKYEDLYEMESPDFVLMFVPIETAFTIAINEDNSLYNKAFEQNIVIVTPSTLLATLRTIDTMWSNEKQRKNAIEIAKQAGALYDKFEGFIKDMTNVGNKMNSAKSDYDDAMKKLYLGQGNLISRVENLKKLGAKAKKSLPDTLLKRAKENSETETSELELKNETKP